MRNVGKQVKPEMIFEHYHPNKLIYTILCYGTNIVHVVLQGGNGYKVLVLAKTICMYYSENL